MHSSEGFAEHMLGLLKNTGSTGSSGSRASNTLKEKDFDGTTRARDQEPVESEWFSGTKRSGSTNIVELQAVTGVRTTRTSRTTNFREGKTLDGEGLAPPQWHAILAGLERQNPPDWIAEDRWADVLADSENFLSRWGHVADELGWTALNLFGVHATAPAARIGCWGLTLLIQGGSVVALTDTTATIRRPSGAVLTHRRSEQSGTILLSELAP